MNSLLVFLLGTFTVYRVTRFLLEDTLIEEPRHVLHHWLLRRNQHLWARKGFELTSCTYCASIWISGGFVLSMLWWGPGLSLPLFWWPALSGSSVVIWKYVETD